MILAEGGLSTHNTEVRESRLCNNVGTIDLVDPLTLLGLDNPCDIVLPSESGAARLLSQRDVSTAGLMECQGELRQVSELTREFSLYQDLPLPSWFAQKGPYDMIAT